MSMLIFASEKDSLRLAQRWQPRAQRPPWVQNRRPSQKASAARRATNPTSRTSAALLPARLPVWPQWMLGSIDFM